MTFLSWPFLGILPVWNIDEVLGGYLGPGVEESRFRIDPEQQTVELFEIRPYFMDTSRKRGFNQIRLNLHHQLYLG